MLHDLLVGLVHFAIGIHRRSMSMGLVPDFIRMVNAVTVLVAMMPE